MGALLWRWYEGEGKTVIIIFVMAAILLGNVWYHQYNTGQLGVMWISGQMESVQKDVKLMFW